MKGNRSSNPQPLENLLDKKVVQEALKKSLDSIDNPKWIPKNPIDDQSSSASLLIHEVFGGEILKTHKKKGWHFYNRIAGERIDLVKTISDKVTDDLAFEDIPTSPEETYSYFVMDDYANFFIRFILAFEETVGLEKFRPSFTL